jgi:hypothetical protein
MGFVYDWAMRPGLAAALEKRRRKAVELLQQKMRIVEVAAALNASTSSVKRWRELNPVEAVWNQTKYGDLANFLPADVEDLHQSIVDSLNRQRSDARLKDSCFRYAKIP